MDPELLIENETVPEVPVPVRQDEETSVDESNEPISDEYKTAFKQLLREARDEDRYIRDEQIRIWRRLEYYWNNILDIFLDADTKEWRVPNWEELESEGEVPPRLINIYRPHGEAIVAALSVNLPPIIFYPDDAENPNDLEAARAYRSISELLARHNDGLMLFIRSIVIMFNQGTVFGYNYYREDPKFGTIDKPSIDFKDFTCYHAFCANCGEPLDTTIEAMPQLQYECQACGYVGPPEISQTKEKLPQIVGFNSEPKGSISQEVFSGLNVKVPAYAKRQEECGYLLLEFYQSTAMLRSIFKDRAKEISSKYGVEGDGFERLPAFYRSTSPNNTNVVSCLWVRPWQFYQLGNSDEQLVTVESLVKDFPNGAYCLFVDDEPMEIVDENLDEHWTFSKNPMGSSVYSRPLGENLSTVQDIRASLTELELQTIEHGIPETFADPRVLDFNKYGQTRAQPGMVTQAKPRPGSSLADAFFTTKTAILSQEVDPVRQHIDQDGQFIVGSFPSVYGGPAVSGSKTASEYSQSRAVALQRLGTTWKILCDFYAEFMGKSVVEYANMLLDEGRDEKFAVKQGNSFVNTWIRSISLTGKVGKVEAEATEQLPISWAQRKDAIQQLMATGIPEILQLMIHPRNIQITKDAIGLPEFYVPGEDDRNVQFEEFAALAGGSYVTTRPMIDKDEVHIEVLTSLLNGPMGRILSEDAMNLCLQHLAEHQMNLAEKLPPQVSAPEKQPKGKQNENVES